jgi:hypothetical protein
LLADRHQSVDQRTCLLVVLLLVKEQLLKIDALLTQASSSVDFPVPVLPMM